MKKDPLQSLAEEILKSRSPQPRYVPQHQLRRVPVPRPIQPSGAFVKSQGPGGLVFDFGAATGNPCADNATTMLNMFLDPVQEQIAIDQRASISKAFEDYTHLGEHAYAQKMDMGTAMQSQVGVHGGWNKQLNKSLDEQVVELVKAEGVGADPGQGTRGDFNKSQMVVGGEHITGQSETDAAVIEMMKSMGADLSGNDTEG